MKDIQQKQETNMLTYAIDSQGRLVNINDVKTGRECLCRCPACKEPLIAKNMGKVRVHHFAHQSGTECKSAYESMLHLLAKKRVQEAFLNSESFYIDYEYTVYCKRENQCKYIINEGCYSNKRNRINLKDYYDSCEQEIAYDNIRRRSDLKIFSSVYPTRKPIYIEFCVTHASDDEKLHSGNKIIECLIESEEDIDVIIKNGFIEERMVYNDYGYPSQNKTLFYDFSPKSTEEQLNCEIEFTRYILYKSGKSRCYKDSCNCRDLKRLNSNSLYEVCFHTSDKWSIYEHTKYWGYDKFNIPNCSICMNYVNNYNGTGKICKLYKYLQISKYEDFDTSRARTCRYFTLNQHERNQLMQIECKVPFDVL